MPVKSIRNASDLLLSPPKPFIWGQLFGDGTSIVHHLLGIMAQLMRCDNSGIDGIVGGVKEVADIMLQMAVSKEQEKSVERDSVRSLPYRLSLPQDG